jgi:hypothetical protein
MKDMGIDEGSKGVATPRVTTSEGGCSRNTSWWRKYVQSRGGERENYLGQDRMDFQFAAKEVSRFTSKPEEQAWRCAKRMEKLLKIVGER